MKKKPADNPILAEAMEHADPTSERSHAARYREMEMKLAKATGALKLEGQRRQHAEDELTETREQLEAYLEIGDKANPRALKRLKQKGGGQATAIICANDWHSEANIEHASSGYTNRYDLNIAKARIDRLWHKAVYLLEFSRKISNIRDAVLWLGGDLINGYIHEELQEGNFLGPADASLWVIERASEGIDYLLREADLDKLTIPCSIGNHGRSTAKTRISTGYRSSWEWMAYNTLARMYRDNPKVEFVLDHGYHCWVDIQGHGVRFHHGDAIKFGGGVGGVHIPLRKKRAQWDKIRPAKLDVLGHFHQFIDEWNYIISGCICGFDAYALSIGAEYQPPTQAFAVIDREYGKTMALPIFCEAVQI